VVLSAAAAARPLRLGILGTARVTEYALLRPARSDSGVEIVAIASRNPDRARAFASRHGIPRAYPSYEALLAAPDIEAVYNPLPNSLHCEWSVRSLDAGKHVLCEKPIAANAVEAGTMAAAARRTGLVLAEAFHWRYHPLAERLRDIVRSGEIGALRHVEGHMCVPIFDGRDIRYQLSLAGGATMDCGCYVISMLRFLTSAEPEVVSARASLRFPGVDRKMVAELLFPEGLTGRVVCSLLSPVVLRITARAVGDLGTLSVFNPIGPHALRRFTRAGLHLVRVRTRSGTRLERVEGASTYSCQLRAFTAAVREGKLLPTTAEDGVLNMRVIDAIYRKAGLSPRGLN
jgi:predicted dehydrogenase